MEKIKIFESAQCQQGEKIEDLINQWFKDNPKIKVKDRLMCEGQYKGAFIISIFYEEQ